MSGWIKMETGLRTHPKVGRMAAILKSDRLRVVGGLHAVWCVFDEHTADGWLPWYTLAMMDEAIGWKGFSQAMADIGWLDERDDGLMAPEYEKHNSASAKRRSMDSDRKKSSRDADKSAHGSRNGGGQMSACDADKSRTERGQVSASDVDEMRTREEDKRKNKSPTPSGFETFWSAYPRKTAKDAALKAFAKLAPDDAMQAELLQAVARQRTSPQWTKDGGEFIPHPSTWLNQRRWEDHLPASSSRCDDPFAGAH